MNARAQDVPSALDLLRDHKARVGRLHDTLAKFNGLTAEHGQLGGTVAMIEAAVTAAKAARWPDQTELARLSGELGAAQAASDRFERKHRDDFARIAQLQRDYSALAGEGKAFEAAAMLEHAMTTGVESFADVAELWFDAYTEWAAVWWAVEVAHGRPDSASAGIPTTVRLPVHLNAPRSAALDSLRLPRDLSGRIEHRARELLAEIQSA